jgi:hypothetical protein
MKGLTKINYHDMLKKLDKRDTINENVEPNEGERTLLSSNKGGMRSPSLDFLDTSSDNVTDEMVLDYLAQIIAEIYFDKTYAITTNEKSSDILPGIDKGAG